MSRDDAPETKAKTTAHRTLQLGEGLRAALRDRRIALGLTVRGFTDEAVRGELPRIVAALADAGLDGRAHDGNRPARLPLSPTSLDALRAASETSGVPASHLLLACLGRAARRRRRRTVDVAAPQRGRSGGAGPRGRAAGA